MGKGNKFYNRRPKLGSFESQTAQAFLQNDYAFQHYCNKIFKLATSCFKWINLPETINELFLERMLFTHGSLLFFYDEILGYLTLPSMDFGQLDVYNLPVKREAYSTNARRFRRTAADSVFIFNDIMMGPGMADLYFFASELYRNKRIRDINLNAQKTPILLEADENERLSMENAFAKYEGNEPVIKYKKSTTVNGLQVLKMDAPYLVDKLDKHESTIWSQVVEYYGIPGVNNLKKERQTSEEVFSNMGATSALADSRMHARKLACKEINLMFGLDIDVDWNENIGKAWDASDEEEGYEDDFILCNEVPDRAES